MQIQNQIFKEFNTYNIIPFNHFDRKNLGFFMCNNEWSKYIYDNDDNKIIEPYNKNGTNIRF